MVSAGEKEVLGEKPVPLSLGPSKSHIDCAGICPFFCGRKPATDRIRYGTAHRLCSFIARGLVDR